jgi:hypothetical protein
VPLLTIYKIIGGILLSSGALGAVFSIFYVSTNLVFIFLTLILWGFLFFLVLPGKYIKGEVMDYMTSSSLLAINQIIEDFELQGKSIYIPVPKGVYLPYYIGAKNEFVYVPKRVNSFDDALEQALMRKAEGIRITPPGLGLVNLLETKSNIDFQKEDLNSFEDILPSLFTKELEMAENLKIKIVENQVFSEISKPVCEDLCKETQNMRHICSNIGCPLCSSIACILTRVTKKPIIIQDCSIWNHKIQTIFRIF